MLLRRGGAPSTSSEVEKDGLAEEFAYLTGPRLDATLSQEARLRFGSATAWYRYRQDRIGTLVQAITPTESSVASQAYVIPFGFMSHAVGGSGRWQPLPWLTASLDAEVEWRRYLARWAPPCARGCRSTCASPRATSCW
ncbi:hypothetical protein D7X12_01820 [Corallococcus sicarius]|uniref:Uncharacterized protein n=1 Tax=Corallococcus sicarius TaxID=2316726 RepID=A0A3A8NWB4_9BACT|nr:hypothetical protein D7X12_01820 [Corallococcus sicarius]